MDGAALVGTIINILVSGITGIGQGIGSALSALATSIFVTSQGALTVFGTLIVVFAAISLGFTLTRWVLNFVTSWGNRNR